MADNDQKQAEMNVTSFSLSRESIENAFSKKQSRPKIPAEYKVALENDSIQNCDKCEYKTSKVERMREHILVKHSEVKHKCTDCNYQHHFPNRVRSHFKQVHMGIPKKRSESDGSCKIP